MDALVLFSISILPPMREMKMLARVEITILEHRAVQLIAVESFYSYEAEGVPSRIRDLTSPHAQVLRTNRSK